MTPVTMLLKFYGSDLSCGKRVTWKNTLEAFNYSLCTMTKEKKMHSLIQLFQNREAHPQYLNVNTASWISVSENVSFL